MEEIEFEGFIIDDDNKADWAIRKIREEKEELDRLDFIANSLIEETRLKIDSQKKLFENKTNFLKTKLYEYFKKVETKKSKTQEKYKLLSGTLVKKIGGQKLEPNKEELTRWLKENKYNDFIKIKEDIDWLELKKEVTISNNKVVIKETGEIIEGINIVEKQDTFEVKI